MLFRSSGVVRIRSEGIGLFLLSDRQIHGRSWLRESVRVGRMGLWAEGPGRNPWPVMATMVATLTGIVVLAGDAVEAPSPPPPLFSRVKTQFFRGMGGDNASALCPS